MDTPDVAGDILRDLLRSAWIIEQARAEVYDRWSRDEAAFQASANRARDRGAVIEEALTAGGYRTDPDLVAPHAGWITSLIGERPGEQPLGGLFIARLGDWVDAHTSPFLGEGGDRLAELSAEEHAGLTFPSSLPSQPSFEPLKTVQVEAPGEVLFSFGILGDMHIGSPMGERMVRAAIADLNRAGVDLVIQLGDITDHGQRDEFELAVDILDDLQVPLTTMMGNHDVYAIHEARLAGREYYGAMFDREPDGVLIEHKGWRFAVLDSIEHGASPFGPFDMVSGKFIEEGEAGAIVRGSLTPPQHELLADVAGPGGGPTFVFLHHPPQPYLGFPPVLFGLRDEDSGRLHAVADSGNLWGVFAGHTHRNARTRTYGTVPVQEVAIPRDFPYGYATVDVTRRGYAYRFRQLSDRELLEEAFSHTNEIFRRYGLGSEEARGFTWTHP